MVFDSYAFLAFFALFFVAYHLLDRQFRAQNVVLLIASAFFYGWWDWRFLGLMFGSSSIDFFAARAMSVLPDGGKRRAILFVSVGSNLLILAIFKYANFFADSLATGFDQLGIHASVPTLNVILPVGISFYTFQSISYAVDVWRREIEAEKRIVSYFAFVCCFPHLVAGPIQRASHLLTQINRPRLITSGNVREAAWLLAWGYFLKTCVSDSVAPIVGMAFKETQSSGWWTLIGTFAFAVQIYCDFNAYSLIARGLGWLLGIEFIWNFRQPYFSTSIQDFWRRWHISLSTWLRDYLYLPLGGSRLGSTRTYLNLMTTMTLGGLWHGASWNFALWGFLHGVALSINRAFSEAQPFKVPAPAGWAATMLVVGAGWLLFRSQSWAMTGAMFSSLGNLEWNSEHARAAMSLAAVVLPVVAVEIVQHRRGDLLVALRLRWSFSFATGLLGAIIFVMFKRFDYGFIYFKF